jgi:hypothetical protein
MRSVRIQTGHIYTIIDVYHLVKRQDLVETFVEGSDARRTLQVGWTYLIDTMTT